MKGLRLVSLAVGAGALLFTVRAFWYSCVFLREASSHFRLGDTFVWNAYSEVVVSAVGRVTLWWPILLFNSIVNASQQPDMLVRLAVTGYLQLFLLASSTVCAGALARSAGRSSVKWMSLTFVFPFVVLMLSQLDSKWVADWRVARRRRRSERLTAKAADLEEATVYDLLFLHDRGFVRVGGVGQSITRIGAEVENLIARSLRIVIKPGTYFVAKGNWQNMVTREEYSVTLYPASTVQIAINAACINASLPIPRDQHGFYGVRQVSDDLTRFLEASKHADAMTVQAGVWALTDNYSGNDVKSHLVVQDQYGNRHQAVTDHNVKEARRILDSIGIVHRL